MSAAVGAALKKVAVALLTDKRTWSVIGVIALTVILLLFFPIIAIAGIFQGGEFNFDAPAFKEAIIQNMSAEDLEKLQGVEKTMLDIGDSMKKAELEAETKKAQVLYTLALYNFSAEPGFVDKLVRCFAKNQTDAQLIAQVNSAFGTALLSDDFSKIMLSISSEFVQIAKSQVGNVGGEPYWSWYGFESRVEWCACFVSWCGSKAGYIEAGLMPKFAGCTSGGMAWFKEHNKWMERDYVPKPGDVIFFCWAECQAGDADHVGIVERVEGNTIFTIEGNSNDMVRQNSYPVGYFEIRGYGVLFN